MGAWLHNYIVGVSSVILLGFISLSSVVVALVLLMGEPSGKNSVVDTTKALVVKNDIVDLRTLKDGETKNAVFFIGYRSERWNNIRCGDF
jgi:hypothetical protein